MVLTKIAYDMQSYTDLQGLEQLRVQASKHADLAKHEIAKQFQAFFIQIALKSMSEANKAMSGGLFGSDQMDFYQDLYNRQLALQMGSEDLGLAKMIEDNINAHYGMQGTNEEQPPEKPKRASLQASFAKTASSTALPKEPLAQAAEPAVTEPSIANQADFISRLWSHAKAAAQSIHLDPRVLLAQAALETDWGKKILPTHQGSSSYNLFNIKADASWDKPLTQALSMEEEGGMLKKIPSKFRSYQSFKESFEDYIKFLQGNSRYQHALSLTHNMNQFLNALQDAGFATDGSYANKIKAILHSPSFNSLINIINK